MNCPVDNTTLQMTSRDGVEIDYCPSCRGVWLDRGELDKVIERSSGGGHSSPDRYEQPRHNFDDRDNSHHDDHRYNDHKKHKKESFMGDLFDF